VLVERLLAPLLGVALDPAAVLGESGVAVGLLVVERRPERAVGPPVDVRPALILEEPGRRIYAGPTAAEVRVADREVRVHVLASQTNLFDVEPQRLELETIEQAQTVRNAVGVAGVAGRAPHVALDLPAGVDRRLEL